MLCLHVRRLACKRTIVPVLRRCSSSTISKPFRFQHEQKPFSRLVGNSGVRLFSGSTSSTESKDEEDIVDDDETEAENANWSDMSTMEKVTYATTKYGIYVLVGGGFTYIVSKTSMYLTSTFIGLSFKTVGFWSFVVGFGSGVTTTGLLYVLSLRSLHIQPEVVKNEAFRKVSSNPAVREMMGVSIVNPLKAGIMRAYSLENGKLAIDTETRSLVYRRPKIKMLFQVYGGNKHQAVVCVEALKKGWSLEYDMLSVDIITKKDHDPLLIEGDEERFKVEGQLRDLVQLKRKYV